MLTPEYRATPMLRDLLNSFEFSRDYLISCGTTERIAATMQEWLGGSVCYGVVIALAHVPEALDDVTKGVCCRRRARGLFREAYSRTTLRDHFGLPVPPAATRVTHDPGSVRWARCPNGMGE